jgi:hypothetical protein
MDSLSCLVPCHGESLKKFLLIENLFLVHVIIFYPMFHGSKTIKITMTIAGEKISLCRWSDLVRLMVESVEAPGGWGMPMDMDGYVRC